MQPKNLFCNAPERLPIPCGLAVTPMMILTQIFHWHFWVFCLSCEIWFYSRLTCVMVWDFTIILHLMLSNIAMSQTFFRSSLWPHSSVIGQEETSCLKKQEASDWRFQVSNSKNFFIGEGLTLLNTEREVFESPSMEAFKRHGHVTGDMA